MLQTIKVRLLETSIIITIFVSIVNLEVFCGTCKMEHAIDENFDRLHNFSVAIARSFKDVMSAISFLAQLDPGIPC